ncbi:hypothetical protein SO694_mt00038 (mitochondrion) [Aureococcus anophagefferens]|uniref:Uncharacterized protein n=1 Tax=Aureococcus anophagefferens TaxID=44056 RepID=A0ABR1FPA0_AURAN
MTVMVGVDVRTNVHQYISSLLGVVEVRVDVRTNVHQYMPLLLISLMVCACIITHHYK